MDARSIVFLAVIIHYLTIHPAWKRDGCRLILERGMTVLPGEPTSSPSSMTSTVHFVKCALLTLVAIVLCTIFLLATNDRNTDIEAIFVLEDENLSTSEDHSSLVNSASNASESLFSFGFEKESFVRLGELERGTAIKPEEIRRTIQRVHETCEKYNETESLKKRHFLYSPKHGALYCWIRKVASTSFTKFFGRLRGRSVAGNYYKEINFLAPYTLEELQSIIQNPSVFKFLLVRHPFERLVSSYRDRIEDNSRFTAQAWIYAPRIFRLSRPKLFYSNATSGTALQRIFTSNRRLKLIPTFVEFVTWLLKEPPTNDDDHWFQYHNHCSLCTANFDYVLKLDNYTRSEVDYIFTKLGLDVHRTDLPKLQSTRGGPTDFPRTCDYFASLSRDDALRLYERYRIDFEMFDYKHEDYVKCANTGEKTAG